MKETSTWQFGLLIAYLLPGFIGLAGLSPFLPVVGEWLRPTDGTFGLGPTVYAILAAITVGMVASCIRWLVIDHIHSATGITRPHWNTRDLESRLGTFNYFVEAHYRYYQFYANTIVALLFSYVLDRLLKTSPLLGFGTDLGVAILSIVLFVGSRDALARYYAATSHLVKVAEKDQGISMTNGCDHDSVGSAPSPKPVSETKADQKPQVSAGKPQQSSQGSDTPREQR